MAEKSVKKRVLILLSAYNGEKYLREQLDSLMALEGDFDFTIRVRDDGSTDGTPAILAAYRREHGIEVIEGENIGYNRSFFALLDGAEDGYDYYALCDQDDVWLPGKFVRADALLSPRDAAVPLLYAGVLCLAGEDPHERRTLPYPQKPPSFYNAMLQDICSGHTMVCNGALLKWVRGSYREGVMNYDHWIYLLASAFGEIVYDDIPQVLYRQHGGNAVGASGSWLGKTLRRIRYLAEGRAGGMARQLAAFYGAYAGKMRLAERKELERFLFSRSFFARVRYAFRSRAYRQSGAETLACKILYIFGKFKTEASANAAVKEKK